MASRGVTSIHDRRGPVGVRDQRVGERHAARARADHQIVHLEAVGGHGTVMPSFWSARASATRQPDVASRRVQPDVEVLRRPRSRVDAHRVPAHDQVPHAGVAERRKHRDQIAGELHRGARAGAHSLATLSRRPAGAAVDAETAAHGARYGTIAIPNEDPISTSFVGPGVSSVVQLVALLSFDVPRAPSMPHPDTSPWPG